MAKKQQKLSPLSMTEIILRGDAETIRQALEARIQIDALLEERTAAYQRIAELETQVCEIVGEEEVFPFPEPPMPVADYSSAPAPKKKPTPKPPVAKTPDPVPAAQKVAEPSAGPESADDSSNSPKPAKTTNNSSAEDS
jgi:hypothetical protein